MIETDVVGKARRLSRWKKQHLLIWNEMSEEQRAD